MSSIQVISRVPTFSRFSLVRHNLTLYQTATRGKGLGNVLAIPKLFWWNAELAISSHLEIEESLHARFHWQLQDASSVWMEVSLQEASAAISLQSIQAIKKEREKSIAKALSIPQWKDGKNILPSKERHDNFQLQAFQCVML